jgi:hypothetical protein
LASKVLSQIKPDNLLEKHVSEEMKIEFIVLKITNRIAKMGKDVRWVFESFDSNKSGHCKYTDSSSLFSGTIRNLERDAEHPSHLVHQRGDVHSYDLPRC